MIILVGYCAISLEGNTLILLINSSSVGIIVVIILYNLRMRSSCTSETSRFHAILLTLHSLTFGHKCKVIGISEGELSTVSRIMVVVGEWNRWGNRISSLKLLGAIGSAHVQELSLKIALRVSLLALNERKYPKSTFVAHRVI